MKLELISLFSCFQRKNVTVIRGFCETKCTNGGVFALTVTEVRVGVLAVAAPRAVVVRVIIHDAVMLPAGHLDDFPRVARIP